ncbi:Ketopantoate reductase PanE/ApbA domain containing protein [Amanita muscaria]
MKDILLVGFGAIGAVCSLALKRGGKARVTVVARSNYDVIKNQGAIFHSSTYGEIQGWRPDRLCKSVAEAADRSYSHVFIASKAVPELTKTPEILAPFLRAPYADKYPQPTYVLLQNGLGVEKDLYKAIVSLDKGEPRVVGTSMHIGANLSKPNEVVHTISGSISIGLYRLDDMTTMKNAAEEASILNEIEDMLSAGGIKVEVVPQIRWDKFLKNVRNVALSSIATLTRYPLSAFYRPPPTQETGPYEPYVHPVTKDKIATYTLPNVKAVMLEMLALGHAIGIPDSKEGFTTSHIEDNIMSAISLHGRAHSAHKPSMLLDMENGLPLEVEPILGEVVRLAEQYKVDIPVGANACQSCIEADQKCSAHR